MANNILFSKILYLDYPLWLSGIGDKNSILHSLELCSIGWMSNKNHTCCMVALNGMNELRKIWTFS